MGDVFAHHLIVFLVVFITQRLTSYYQTYFGTVRKNQCVISLSGWYKCQTSSSFLFFLSRQYFVGGIYWHNHSIHRNRSRTYIAFFPFAIGLGLFSSRSRRVHWQLLMCARLFISIIYELERAHFRTGSASFARRWLHHSSRFLFFVEGGGGASSHPKQATPTGRWFTYINYFFFREQQTLDFPRHRSDSERKTVCSDIFAAKKISRHWQETVWHILQ